MQEINFKNRLVFGNIYIKKNDSFVLLNLYSFRRMLISHEDLQTLLKCRDKLSAGIGLTEAENTLYAVLLEKKQIISNDLLASFLSGKAKEHEDNLHKITPKVNRIAITPTFSCNFNCAYCYQRNFKTKADHISSDAIDDICKALQFINKTEDYTDGITRVTINGGEPLQTCNLETINRIIERFAKPGIHLALMTNGYNILKFREDIDFSKFDSVQISLDDIDPYASRINGVNHPVFSEVLDGISFLMRFDCQITIATIFTKDLVNHIDEFIERLNSIGIVDNERCQINISPVAAFGESTLDNSFYSIRDFIEAKRLLKGKRLPSNLSIGSIPEIRWIARALRRKRNDRIYGKPSMCSILDNRSILFAPNGQIYWCLCVDPSVGVLGRYYPSIEIDESGIDRCIQKSVFSDDKCKNCAFKFLCSSGCPIHAVAATGDYGKPFCGFFSDPEFWENLEDLLE